MIKLRKHIHSLMRNDRGDISIFACFFVTGVIMLVSFLMLYASVRITCINIRNGAKMELNNLIASIYADTYRSQRESNFSEYLQTLYQSASYTRILEQSVKDGLESKSFISSCLAGSIRSSRRKYGLPATTTQNFKFVVG